MGVEGIKAPYQRSPGKGATTVPEMGNFRWLSVGVPGQDDVAITLMAVPGPPAAAAASQLRGPRGGDAKMPRGDSEPTDARPEGMLLRPELVVLLILAGAAIAAAVILPFAHSTQRSQKFVESPEFVVWFVLIAAQTALWAVSCAVFLGVNRRLGQRFPSLPRVVWVANAAFLAALLLPPVFTLLSPSNSLNSPLSHHSDRMRILVLLGALVGTVGVNAIARVAAAATLTRPYDAPRAMKEFIYLRDELQTVLFFLGAMIGALTLASGTLRHLLITRGGVKPNDFPPELVLVYGAYFSILLVAAYAPVYNSVLGLGRRIRDELCGEMPDDLKKGDMWAGWYAHRNAVEDFLELKKTTTQRLQAALALIAPFAGSALSLFIGIGH